MNKRAIMVKFLVTLLLALLIFFPACKKATELFSLSTAAKNDFVDVVNSIAEIKDGTVGERKTELLVLDEGTALLYFDKGSNQITIGVDGALIDSFPVSIIRPASCDSQKTCLCLLRKWKFDEVSSSFSVEFSFKVTPEKIICDSNLGDVKLNLLVNENPTQNNCGVGKKENVDGYICTGGFVVERNIVKTISDETTFVENIWYEAPRRSTVQLTKKSDHVLLEI